MTNLKMGLRYQLVTIKKFAFTLVSNRARKLEPYLKKVHLSFHEIEIMHG